MANRILAIGAGGLVALVLVALRQPFLINARGVDNGPQ